MFEDIISAAKGNVTQTNFDRNQMKIEPEQELSDISIAVLGVGGAGCNCIDRLLKSGIKSATTIAINTDAKQLNAIESHKKVLIGKTITKGLGAGGYVDVGRKCAENDRGLLKKEIGENQLVFLTAGMGGGTGTGAAPVVAEIAKEQGAIVVAIVTYPFALERVRLRKAQEGIQELVKAADTVVVIDNNRLTSYAPNLPITQAFELADSITGRAVRGIADTIMFPSLMNVDYADVKAVMQDGRLAMISLGEGTGVEKVEAVVKDTLEHPLLDVSYENAKGCMLHIEGGPDLTLGDAIRVGTLITENFSPESNVKIGARVNPQYTDKIRVTAIITGVKSPCILRNEAEPESFEGSDENLQYL